MISTRLIFLISVAILLVGLVLFGARQCQSRKAAEKQAEVSQGQAGAAIDSGVVAVETASNIIASDDATDAQVAAAQRAIAEAAAGQKGAAAKREVCKFRSYQGSPECRETPQ